MSPDVDQLGARDLNAHGACERHHGVFVFRHRRKATRRQLDDPRTAHAAGWNGEAARGFHDGGKLELHARE